MRLHTDLSGKCFNLYVTHEFLTVRSKSLPRVAETETCFSSLRSASNVLPTKFGLEVLLANAGATLTLAESGFVCETIYKYELAFVNGVLQRSGRPVQNTHSHSPVACIIPAWSTAENGNMTTEKLV